MTTHVSPEFRRQLEGYGLTTAHIFYRLPDHPNILQEYLWQFEDVYPRFPRLSRFLHFWEKEIEGPLHSVRVGHVRLIGPQEFRPVDGIFRIH